MTLGGPGYRSRGPVGRGAPSSSAPYLLGQPLPVLLRSPAPRGQLSGRGEESFCPHLPRPPPSLHILRGSQVLLLAGCGPGDRGSTAWNLSFLNPI